MFRLPTLAAICALVCACSSAPDKPAVSEPGTPEPTQVAASPPVQETVADKRERTMREFAAKSISFGANSHSISTESQSMLTEVAEFLRSYQSVSLTLVGNSDERGSGSRAIGLKRAEAVKRALVALGVAEDRLHVLSQGKDQPRATCHEEKCWAQNRRVDFVFQDNAKKS